MRKNEELRMAGPGRNKLPKDLKTHPYTYCLRGCEAPIFNKAMDIVRLRRNYFLLGDRQEAINKLVDEFSEMVRV